MFFNRYLLVFGLWVISGISRQTQNKLLPFLGNSINRSLLVEQLDFLRREKVFVDADMQIARSGPNGIDLD